MRILITNNIGAHEATKFVRVKSFYISIDACDCAARL